MEATREGVAPRGLEISAEKLTRRFGNHVAIDALDLVIPANVSFGLLGANGAGKTTFIRMLTGYLLPSSGQVRVGGVSPVERRRAVCERTGFVMETSRLYPELGVESFLRFAAGARGLCGAALRDAVAANLARFGLEAVARRPIGNLSKGYQQRVSLAQAFLHDPPLLIVDEPTSGLDPLQRDEVHALLASLSGTRTLLLCTHDLAEARRLTSRVAVLRAGRLVAEGHSEELLGGGEAALALFRAEARA